MAYGSDETESLSMVHLEKSDIDGSGRRRQKRKTEYYIHCNHCGFESRKSRFKRITQWFWNHANNPVAPTRKERRYHIYGREF